MRKFFAASVAALVITASLCGCAAQSELSGDQSISNSDTDSSSSSTSSDSVSSSSASSDSSSSNSTSSNSSSSTSTSSGSVSSSNTSSDSSSSNSTSSVSVSSSSTSSDNTPIESSSSESSSSTSESEPPEEPVLPPCDRIQFPNTRAGELAKAALSVNPDEWSFAMNIETDPEYLSYMFPEFDPEICADHCLVFDMIGINSHEVLIAKAKPGREDELKAAFDAHFNYLHSPDKFLYPAGAVSVEASINNSTKDGYLYIIVHADAALIENALN